MLLGHAEARYAARGLILHALEAAARARTRALVTAALGADEAERRIAAGRELTLDQATMLAFETFDTA
jgi:hypothetical protein